MISERLKVNGLRLPVDTFWYYKTNVVQGEIQHLKIKRQHH